MEKKLREFFADQKLVELVELAKNSNDLLALLTPRENQHSDILAWCFNSREGHGQSDAILKDFLLAAVQAATDDEPGDKLYGKGLGRDFVREWTPARIMTTSFATAVSYREYTLPRVEGETGNRRLDLLVVDPDNQILLVVENKAGANFTEGQLPGYLEAMQQTLLRRAVFKSFKVAFVALDRNFDPEDVTEDRNFDERWIRLNYEWLRPAGQRAEVAVARGNESAALLLSYCRRQTGWESKDMKAMTRIAGEIVSNHPAVVSRIRNVRDEFRTPERWTPQLLETFSTDGQLLKLYLQNEEAIKALLELSPIQLLRAKLSEHFPVLNQTEEAWEFGHVWTNYRLPLENALPQVDYWWPLYARVRLTNPDSNGHPKFRIRLMLKASELPDDERAGICERLSKNYPAAPRELAVYSKSISLFNEECTSIDEAEKVLKMMFKKVEKAFAD